MGASRIGALREVTGRTHEVSADLPDWTREHKQFWRWDPGRSLLANLRAYQYHRARPGPWHRAMRAAHVLLHRFWQIVCGADIPLNTEIGGGLLLPHPNGVVIHPQVVIGPNCLIFQQVTLGSNGRGVPVVGGHVDVGAGAKILGPVSIGNHARIGANAVVLCNVPPQSTAVGVPAQVLQHS